MNRQGAIREQQGNNRGTAREQSAQGEIKPRALVLFAFGPDGAAVLLDDTLDQTEADAGALELVVRLPLQNVVLNRVLL